MTKAKLANRDKILLDNSTSVKSLKKEIISPYRGFPGGSVVKNPPANAGDMGSMLGSISYPGERNGNPFQ